MIVKATALVAGGGALAVGTYFVTTALAAYSPTTLTQEKDGAHHASSDYTTGKIGKDLASFLVSPFNPHNEQFWKKSYEKWQQADQSTISDDFKNTDASHSKIDKAYGTKDDKALNKVCYSIYKDKVTSDIDLSEANKKQLTTDLFAYCSVLGELPVTLSANNETSYGDATFGKTKQDKLLSTKKNQTLWTIKTKDFFGSSESISDAFFKHFRENNKWGSLKTRCEEAYGKPSSGTAASDNQPSESAVLKYCTLLGS